MFCCPGYDEGVKVNPLAFVFCARIKKKEKKKEENNFMTVLFDNE